MLSQDEIARLVDLIEGVALPSTGMEKHFMQVTLGTATPCTAKEREWVAFLAGYQRRKVPQDPMEGNSENPWLNVPLLDFINEFCDPRIRNALQNAACEGNFPSGMTVRDFLAKGNVGFSALMRIPNIGRKSINNLRLELEHHGFLVKTIPPVVMGNHNPSDTSPFVVSLETIHDILERLDLRRKEIIVLRFGLHADDIKTLQEIGDKLSLSRERVRQLEKRGISRLKSHLSRVAHGRDLDISNLPEKFIPLLSLIGKVINPRADNSTSVTIERRKSGRSGKRWSKEEIENLTNLWRNSERDSESVRQIEALLGRSPLAIIIQLHKAQVLDVKAGDQLCLDCGCPRNLYGLGE